MLSKRRSLENAERERLNESIYEKTINESHFKNASSVFIYINTASEVETTRIIEYAFAKGKRVCVPVTKGDEMVFAEIKSLEGMKKSSLGILEPESYEEAASEKDDLFIIPGSVFDEKGHRYGFGKGYYDRYLSSCPKVTKLALCYDFQLLKEIKTEKHDIDMDIIITEKRMIYPKGGKI